VTSLPTRAATSQIDYATKGELVYQHLREQIVNEVLPAGAHLHLQDLATSLGVSTVPVREALRRLESEGLVRNRPHAGATVAALDVEKIEVHFMIRGALEGLAVRLAAEHLRPQDLDHFDYLHRRLHQLAQSADFAAWNDVNIEFYRSLFACSHSLELMAMIDLQRDRSPRFRHFPEALRQRASESDESRNALLQALRSRDGVTAEHFHRQNVTRTGSVLCTAMQRVAAAHSPNGKSNRSQKGGQSSTQAVASRDHD
jgi:DNA-binding GntR family transcriptional regulator